MHQEQYTVIQRTKQIMQFHRNTLKRYLYHVLGKKMSLDHVGIFFILTKLTLTIPEFLDETVPCVNSFFALSFLRLMSFPLN